MLDSHKHNSHFTLFEVLKERHVSDALKCTSPECHILQELYNQISIQS